MNAVKIAGIVLIVAGALALVAGTFSWTQETQHAKVGPISLSVKERQTFHVPPWAALAAMVVGGALVVFGTRKG